VSTPFFYGYVRVQVTFGRNRPRWGSISQ